MPIPRAGGTAAEIDAVTENQKLVSVIIDSGAEVMVWPSELALEIPIEESEESPSSVKYCTFWTGTGENQLSTRKDECQSSRQRCP